jgi:benzodiazapine receptor
VGRCHDRADTEMSGYLSKSLGLDRAYLIICYGRRIGRYSLRMGSMRLKSAVRLVASLLMCLGIGVLEALVTRPEIPTWYASLNKPSWTPPPVVFPIAWTALYILMAVSFWRLWETEPRSAARSKAMVWFLVQLALNAAWSPVFFGWHDTKTALVIIVALLIAIGATVVSASRVDRAAAWLLTPYLAWVAYATTINAGVVAMN